jgi:hypothetical protein
MFNRFDLSLIKRFPLDRWREGMRLRLQVDFFNLFNRVNFGSQISNLSAATINQNTGQIIEPGDFGRITATSNNPRLIQFALKLNF